MKVSNEGASPVSLFELAREFNISPLWLREQAEAGLIPSLLAGNRRLFDPTAVLAALAHLAAAQVTTENGEDSQ